MREAFGPQRSLTGVTRPRGGSKKGVYRVEFAGGAPTAVLLDHDRLRFHGLAQRLSLVAGPLRLLDGDFPDREFMLRIAERNTERALDFLDQRKIPVWPSE